MDRSLIHGVSCSILNPLWSMNIYLQVFVMHEDKMCFEETHVISNLNCKNSRCFLILIFKRRRFLAMKRYLIRIIRKQDEITIREITHGHRYSKSDRCEVNKNYN
jgi:hypothetical protein